jgi:hypothetical protein
MRHDVQLALDGLNEGFRVIGAELNKILSQKYPVLNIKCPRKRESDSIESAREKLLRSLPKLPSSLEVPSDVKSFSVWTLGAINGNLDQLYPVPLGHYSNDYEKAIELLASRTFWSETQWLEFIVVPVAALQNNCTSRLEGLIPKTGMYSAGEEAFRRDERIAEMARNGWTNDQIAREIEDKCAIEGWEPIAPNHIKKRLKAYYEFIGDEKPTRTGGRPPR